MKRHHHTPSRWLELVGVVILTVIEFAIVGWIQRDNQPLEAAAAAGVLVGHPHWRIYQGRILGPYLVEGFWRLTGVTFTRAYAAVEGALLVVGNLVCFRLFSRAGAKAAWIYTVACAACFIGLQDREWLYLWDYADIIVFLLFGWAIVRGKPPWVFVVLFCCELLNREVAVLIALWLVIDAVQIRGTQTTVRWIRALIGLALIGAGELWLEFVRASLFVSQTMTLGPSYQMVGDAIWMLPHNYADLMRPGTGLDALRVLVAFIVTIVLMKRAWAGLGDRAWKVAVLLVTLVGSTILFGRIFEMRVWLCLGPLWLWLDYAARMPRSGPEVEGALKPSRAAPQGKRRGHKRPHGRNSLPALPVQ